MNDATTLGAVVAGTGGWGCRGLVGRHKADGPRGRELGRL
jgi:hypothetical protein